MFAVAFFLIPACNTNTEIEDPANISETTIELSAKSEDSKTTDNTVALGMLALSEDYKVPVAEAQQQALEAAQEFRGLEGITTKAPLAIASIEKIKDGKKELVVNTKAEDENKKDVSDIYLINFENDQGYALLSGDKRVSGTLAYISTGQGDDITNPSVGILMQRVAIYVKNKKS